MHKTLQEWLDWQLRLHSRSIDLGLERVAEVAARLGVEVAPGVTVSVAGTNGKGSVVTMLESVYGSAGYGTFAYTSPHLLRYNERIRFDGHEIGDEALCAAFARVEAARQQTPLTYFEFGTLAALYLAGQRRLDVWLLEVGLGGRLDAVNLIDADVAAITTIDLDHQDWLGPDRESIGAEKAGIMRPGKPAVCGDRDPPASLLRAAQAGGTPLLRLGREFDVEQVDTGWSWRGTGTTAAWLPEPGLSGRVQGDNLAVVAQVVELLQPRLPVTLEQLRRGLSRARLPGRMQRLFSRCEIWFDVGHNPAAVRALVEQLRLAPAKGRTRLVFGMFADKDLAGCVGPLAAVADTWYPATLDSARGYAAGELARRLSTLVEGERGGLEPERPVAEALRAALADSAAEDRIVVSGSFLTVAAAMSWLLQAGPERTTGVA